MQKHQPTLTVGPSQHSIFYRGPDRHGQRHTTSGLCMEQLGADGHFRGACGPRRSGWPSTRELGWWWQAVRRSQRSQPHACTGTAAGIKSRTCDGQHPEQSSAYCAEGLSVMYSTVRYVHISYSTTTDGPFPRSLLLSGKIRL